MIEKKKSAGLVFRGPSSRPHTHPMSRTTSVCESMPIELVKSGAMCSGV